MRRRDPGVVTRARRGARAGAGRPTEARAHTAFAARGRCFTPRLRLHARVARPCEGVQPLDVPKCVSSDRRRGLVQLREPVCGRACRPTPRGAPLGAVELPDPGSAPRASAFRLKRAIRRRVCHGGGIFGSCDDAADDAGRPQQIFKRDTDPRRLRQR